ncbi:undecaprenyl-diphosphate phosphatase [Flavobacteriaceae bacterium UJ101]|nr:undecaprenyl-diphosphate phosphatase [Flavobacteriaceae bacterium UJ101]
MEEIIKAIIVGIIQGLTEFLPVSSSGHIELSKAILNLDFGEQSLLFTLVLHTATALSTVVIFKNQILDIISGIFKGEKEDINFAIKVVISMIPAVLIGLLLKDQIEALFSGNILLVGIMLLITAGLLYLADKAKDTQRDVSFRDSLIIGIAQGIAILPGISRSGATISTSVLLGNDRSKAATFSFLMVIPVILGAMAKDLIDEADTLSLSTNEILPLIAGFIAAFIFGIIACKWMVSLVKKAKLTYFSIYCLIVGTLAIGYALFIQ